jgi:hypothetical protein
MTGPKFSEVLRAYGKGLTAPWDDRWKNMEPGKLYVGFGDGDRAAEVEARGRRAGFEELAKLYELYETGEKHAD